MFCSDICRRITHPFIARTATPPHQRDNGQCWGMGGTCTLDDDNSNSNSNSNSTPIATTNNNGPLTNKILKTRVAEWLENKEEARKKYGDIGDWDTSEITSTAYLFEKAVSFNDDISRWDLSKVRDAQYMFWGATVFNSDVAKWNLSSVEDTSFMFL